MPNEVETLSRLFAPSFPTTLSHMSSAPPPAAGNGRTATGQQDTADDDEKEDPET